MRSDDLTLQAQAAQLGELLIARGWSVTTAESCTGGWVAKVLTDVAGSSQWFARGFVTYSNEAKFEMLGVPAADLDLVLPNVRRFYLPESGMPPLGFLS